MLAGYLRTTGLERALDRQRDTDGGWRFLGFARNDRGGARNDRGGARNDRGGARNDRGGDCGSESIHDFLSPGKRAPQERLLARKCHFLRAELCHKRDQHTRKKARLAHMNLRMLQCAKLRRYSSDCQNIAIHRHFGTKILRDLNCSFVVSAWRITFKVRDPVSQSRCNYSTLRETFGNRHGQGVFATIDETEVSIYRLHHLISRPLARSSRFGLRQSCICIWSPLAQAVQSRLASFFSHAEGNQAAIRPFRCVPVVKGKHPLRILPRLRCRDDLHHIRTMIMAFLDEGLKRLERIRSFEIMV